MKTNTEYVLIHRITRKRLPYPDRFSSMTAGNLFSILADLHADCVPASRDLFGNSLPEHPEP